VDKISRQRTRAAQRPPPASEPYERGSGFAAPSSRVARSSRCSRIGRWPRLSSTQCFPLAAPRLVSNSVEMMKAFARINRGVSFQFRRPGKAPIPPGDMIALPLIDPPLLQARLVLATRRGRVLPVVAAAFVELLKTALA